MKVDLMRVSNFLGRHVCALIFLLCIFFSFKYQITENKCEKIIKADGLGYYSYLPAIFIYNDYTFSFTKEITEKNPKINFGDGFLKASENGKVNKYYVGLAILWLPFFLIAHILALISGLPADGYSPIYQIAVLLAANIYLWVGCRYTLKLIMQYAVPKNVAALLLVALVFGTNLFFYTSYDASHSHVYSFAIVAAFLFFGHSFFKNDAVKYFYLAVFLLGVITLLRPTNAIIAAMLLFFAGSVQVFWQTIRKHLSSILIAVVIFAVTIFPQFLLYYLQSGSFIVWSYGDEKFYFDNPQFFNVLFSYRKGFFVYTPLALLSVFGAFYLFEKNRFQFFVLTFLVFVVAYIISSWWCWWYGASLGQRAFVDYYALLGMLLAFSYLWLEKKYAKIAFFTAIACCIYYSLTLSYQYRNSIIDSVDMNKQKFWFTFLRTDKGIEGLAHCNGLFSNIETHNIVNIKATNNMYLSADADVENHVFANRHNASLWEAFNLLSLNDGKVAILSYNGKYVSARLDNHNILTHVADEVKDWELFEMEQVENDTFLLKASNGQYIVRNEAVLSANGAGIQEAERFVLIRK